SRSPSLPTRGQSVPPSRDSDHNFDAMMAKPVALFRQPPALTTAGIKFPSALSTSALLIDSAYSIIQTTAVGTALHSNWKTKIATGVSKLLSRSNFDSNGGSRDKAWRERFVAMCGKESCAIQEILRCDCIQSLRFGVMLAECKKRNLANE